MANLSKTTNDHEEIQRWAEERGGKPAHVKSTGSAEDIGILRIDFPGYSGQGSLEEISWDQFFEKFDERGLSLIYQEETAGGERSNFNKLVSAETAEQNENGRASKSSRKSAKKSAGKKSSAKGLSVSKKSAPVKSSSSKKASKTAGKKTAAKKSGPSKKTAAKTAAPAKKSVPAKKKAGLAKKAAPAKKKAAAKKSAAKKTPAKKTASKKGAVKKRR